MPVTPTDIALSPDEKQFIRTHIGTDVTDLVLHEKQFTGLNIKKLAAQIVARQKAQVKLPGWFLDDKLVFPPPVSVEQASSAVAAAYKASLVSGGVLLDLTGGLGADTAAFADRMTRVVYAERDPTLARLAAHNLPALGHQNVSIRGEDGLLVLQHWPDDDPPDWIYLDPARRDARGGKLVQLADCEPDLTRPDWQTALRKAKKIVVKTSPLIDIDGAVRQLSACAVQVVAVQNEVKEVLFIVDNQLINERKHSPDPSGDAVLRTAVNLLTTDAPFAFSRAEERAVDLKLGDPMAFIYEPNAALLKAGAFRLLGARFGVTKLAPHSHIYTSGQRVPDFPGRIFQVEASCKPDRRALQAILPAMKANLTTRNFPQPTEALRQQLGLTDGGDMYIFGTTLNNGAKRLLICRKIINLT